jgi:hypothetical protein
LRIGSAYPGIGFKVKIPYAATTTALAGGMKKRGQLKRAVQLWVHRNSRNPGRHLLILPGGFVLISRQKDTAARPIAHSEEMLPIVVALLATATTATLKEICSHPSQS